MKWGVRRHRRREERIAKAEASGNKRKAERLRRQRAKVEQYRTSDSTAKDVAVIGAKFIARRAGIRLTTMAASMATYNSKASQWVKMASAAAEVANSAKMISDVANVVEAKTTQKVRNKK